jgi:hypothetical protein
MVDFLYTLDYDDDRIDNKDQPPASTPHNPIPTAPFMFTFPVADSATAEQTTGLNPLSLLVNAKVYVIAEKYDIQALKQWAVVKYKEVLLATWNSSSFIESAILVFENTPESDRMLREVIIQKASENARALFDRNEFVALLESHGSFAAEVLRDVLFNQPDEVSDVADDWGFGMAKKKDKKKNRS